MNGTSQTEVVEVPPGHPGQPYVMSSLNGEIIYIPCSKSATRLLVTGKETDNAFAVVGSGGSQGDPIGFHFHKEAHDVFLCLKGAVNVWAGKKCRTMTPGDFASVPPVSRQSPEEYVPPLTSHRMLFISIRSWEIIPNSLASLYQADGRSSSVSSASLTVDLCGR